MTTPQLGEEAADAQQQLDLVRRRIMAVIGHELRTPVTSLRGLADQLEGASPAQIRDVLGPALSRNARRVERLLDDLLVASEITTALPVGEPQPVEVSAAARRAWDELDPGFELAVEGPEGIATLSRPGSLERALRHLLDNAVKYGTPPVTVYIRRAGRQVEIDVHSPGEGLPDVDLELAPELLYRGERAVMTTPGLGIGLPAAIALVRHDGGDVHLTRRHRGGLVAHLRLPAA